MRLLWLPDKLRAYGLTVVEQPGWKTRGNPFPATPKVAVGHHTATSAKAPGDLPTLRILRDGRSDLPGPLCQIALSRSGVAHVIASGKANHAGQGSWASVTSSSLTVGCEVEHPGTGPWQPQQIAAFDRVMAALLDGLGQGARMYCGHREWARPRGRKVDPAGVDLDRQRHRIASLLAAGPRPTSTPTPAPSTVSEDEMKLYVYTHQGLDWGTDLVTRRPFEDQAVKATWIGLAKRLGHTVERITLTDAEAESLPAVGL